MANQTYPRKMATVKLIVRTSQMRIQRSQLQEPRSRYPVPHSPTKPGLRHPIFIRKQGANEHQVSIRGTKHPLAIIGNINTSNRRTETGKRRLRHPHRGLRVQPYLPIKRPHNNGPITGGRKALKVSPSGKLMPLAPMQNGRRSRLHATGAAG